MVNLWEFVLRYKNKFSSIFFICVRVSLVDKVNAICRKHVSYVIMSKKHTILSKNIDKMVQNL